MPDSAKIRETKRIALGSIGVGAAVLGLKYLAYWLTGSVALLSDALESIVNVAAAIAAFVAISYSARPADAEHPYGHHKAEYFSSVIEGVLIVLAALLIFREAWDAYLAPRGIEAPVEGLAVNGLATAVNGAWCWVLLRHGRKRRSPALVADGKHLFADVLSSVGVFAGVSLAAATGWLVLDPLLAAIVGVNILWSGWGLVKESVGGLMDSAPPPEEVDRIREVISRHADGAIEAHDLRTRHAGRATFVDFHLVVPGKMSVSEAHDICDRIEKALREEVGTATITIHVEPEEKAKHSGIVVL
ncbi:MAG: cation diffusion facilitator family transporter [Pseudomonadota bacterium]|nr:cation diffusion facilitator family transporter [Pseudomonadota bacterium]